MHVSTNQQPITVSADNPSNGGNDIIPTVTNGANDTVYEEPVHLQTSVVHTSQDSEAVSVDNPLYDGNDNIIPISTVTNSTNNIDYEEPVHFQTSVTDASGDGEEYEEPIPSTGHEKGDKPTPYIYISMLDQAEKPPSVAHQSLSLHNGPLYAEISTAVEESQ